MDEPVLATELVAMLSAMYFGWQHHKRQLTTDELKTLLPALKLTISQRAYAEAILALTKLKLPKDMENDLWEQMNRLLDEEARLITARQDAAAGGSSSEDAAREITELEAKIASTTDSVTRETLEQTLRICQARLHSGASIDVVVQRIDAQQELIAQTMRGIRDSLRRLQSSNTVKQGDLDIDSLRTTVAAAGQHADSLESAVREVRTLG